MNAIDNDLCGLCQRVTEWVERTTGITCFQCASVALFMTCVFFFGTVFYDMVVIQTSLSGRVMDAVFLKITIVVCGIFMPRIAKLAKDVDKDMCFGATNRKRRDYAFTVYRLGTLLLVPIMMCLMAEGRSIKNLPSALVVVGVVLVLYLCSCTPLPKKD